MDMRILLKHIFKKSFEEKTVERLFEKISSNFNMESFDDSKHDYSYKYYDFVLHISKFTFITSEYTIHINNKKIECSFFLKRKIWKYFKEKSLLKKERDRNIFLKKINETINEDLNIFN